MQSKQNWRMQPAWHVVLGRLRRKKRALFGLGMLLCFVVLALAGPPVYQHLGAPYTSHIDGVMYGPQDYHNYARAEIDRLNEMPSGQHWLGTDQVGRDILARLLRGLLVSLVVAALVETLVTVAGISIGVLAGYYGGWLDQVLARCADLVLAFPGLLFVILLTGIFGKSADEVFGHLPVIGVQGNARLLLIALALAVISWPLMARYVRGQTLQIKEQQFILAARACGSSDLRIILRHILPHLSSIVVVAITLDIPSIILGEAGISMLGLGVQSPGSSLGLMIAQAAGLMEIYPWEMLVPAGALVWIVLACAWLGDGLRDACDPRSPE